MNSKEVLKKETAAVSNRYVLMGDKETDPKKKEHYYRMALNRKMYLLSINGPHFIIAETGSYPVL